MTTDTTLTESMRAFRECARHVWNTYFQAHEDGWHEFINVEYALFSGMVLSRLGLPYEQQHKDPAGYYPAIRVVPQLPPCGLPILFVDPQPVNGCLAWAEARLASIDFDMRFMGFFDFAGDNDLHDFRYVRVRVLGGPDPLYIGKDVLLEMPFVAFLRFSS